MSSTNATADQYAETSSDQYAETSSDQYACTTNQNPNADAQAAHPDADQTAESHANGSPVQCRMQ